MQVEVSSLLQQLEKISFSGQVESIALDFVDKGLGIKFFASNQSVGGVLLVKKDLFVDYQPIGLLGIMQLSQLTSFLSRLKGKHVTLSQEGENVQHLIFRSQSLDGIFRTAPLRYIEKIAKLKLPVFTPTTSFTLPKETLQEIASNMRATKSSEIAFNLKGDQLLVSSGKEYSFVQKIQLSEPSPVPVVLVVSSVFAVLSDHSKGPLTIKIPPAPVSYILTEETGDVYQYRTVISVQVDKGE